MLFIFWPAILVFFIWHLLAFPASNGYNVTLIAMRRACLAGKTARGRYQFVLLFDTAEGVAFLLGFLISWEFAFAVLLYGNYVKTVQPLVYTIKNILLSVF